MAQAGRILALDYGTKRVGWAVTSENRILVEEIGTIVYHDRQALWKALQAVISQKQKVQTMLVGYPVNMDGTVGQRAQEVDAFIGELTRQFGLPVVKWDERLTSYMAQKINMNQKKKVRQNKARLDSLAAGIMLDEYLQNRVENGT
jgi:putative Holliday junction resolvase